ncbi:peptidase S8 and S53, subtilisin, kexin, sedolisin [Cystobacter fuscus DSM 2262]|uniref:Peptidase S8 and S53, subtilisin, kexin, sedolisin n=1 Tax=Cystobacter fuscus (strain ATCC 25194 / DSM 2262 / NBRC 100088 / M29) TaxID=1242864 RepID=S9PQ70_CYSF2|nr:S8 family serine peptidase [Cystobacter fuscus]EPX65171.1 peptidase S8 and S53, subtilisin, kexin, sedolisin [Cystobacter fuscus DSM 2262]
MMERIRMGHVATAAGLVGLATLVLLLPGCERSPGGAPREPVHPEMSVERGYVEGELLVRFREPAQAGALAALEAAPGARIVHSYESLPGLRVIRLPRGADMEQALAAYQRDPRVLYAGRNAIYSIDSTPRTPGDPLFGGLWGMNNTGQDGGSAGADIGAPQAWGLTTGSSEVVLALIDSGMDYTHPDLAANVWWNPGEIPGNGRDDDANGYVDDVHGINAITGTGDPLDDGNHGTHVAGILGAAGDNGLGVTGVNWNVKLIACKFLDKTGNGAESDALKCMDYLWRLKTRAQHPVHIVATNNSWSCRSQSCNSDPMRQAIQKHLGAGMLFVAAAGNVNANIDVAESWPAKHQLPNMLVVAATDRKDARWNLSSYGRHTVHLGAPGVDILSTVPGNAYQSFNGTSMAAPHVTGVAGLLATQDPTRDWKAIRNLLLAGGRAIPGLSGVTLTGRRLRAWGPEGSGALNCEGQSVTQRMKPVVSAGRIATVVGFPISLAVLNIRCAEPAGAVSVDVSGSAETTLPLGDEGEAEDLAAGDGIYSGRFTPTTPGTYTLTFPGGESIAVDVFNHYGPARQQPSTYEVMTEANTHVVGASDETTSILSTPFPIRFAGMTPGFSTLYVNSNGYITFAPVPSASGNTPLPSTFFPSALLPLWQNLEVPGVEPSGLYHETLGTSPHRKFVIEWRDVAISPIFPTQPLKFQVVFFEDSSDIAFNYANVFYGDEEFPELDNGASATVGIQLLPTVVQQYSYLEPKLNNGTSLLFRTLASSNVLEVTAPVLTTSSPKEGTPVTLQASFSTPNASDGPWTVEWNCQHQGGVFVAESEQSHPEPGPVTQSCHYSAQGTYTVALRVTSRSGEHSEVQSTTFDVADVSPRILSFTATPQSGAESLEVRFTVEATTGAANGQVDAVVDYQWDFDGDGTFDTVTTAPQAQHLYDDNPATGSTFRAKVRVRDPDSATDAVLPVTVTNAPPVITPITSQKAVCGTEYTLQLSASDPGRDTLSFALNQSPSGMTITPTGLIRWTPNLSQNQCGWWQKSQSHDVKVDVSDGDGATTRAEFKVQAFKPASSF